MSDVAPGWSQHRFLSFDETPIAYRRLVIAARPRAVFMIVHGMGEHGGRYREFAEMLASKNIASFLPDLRGFGDSGGKRGCVRQFTDHFQDLSVTHRLITQAYPGVPMFVFGHSFGGLVVSSWLAQSGIVPKGLILSSPNFGIAIHVPLWRSILARVASTLIPDYTQDNRVDVTRLTHDTALLLIASKDNLIHHQISARLYTELMAMIRLSAETASKLRCPALVLQAGDDHIVSRPDTVAFFEKLTSQDKELEIYEGFYHEILNEIRRSEVYSRILAWTEKRI